MPFSINSPILFLLAGIAILAVLAQSVLFTLAISRILYKKGLLA